MVSLESGAISGMEALLRWNHPRHGLIPAAKFLAEAERTGLIVPIGRWVLESACRQMAEWEAAGIPALSLSVNMSAVQLRAADFPTVVDAALRSSQLAPERLELDITEGSSGHTLEPVADTLWALRRLGVRLLVDDFDSSNANFRRLAALPINGLKVDARFGHGQAGSPTDLAIIAGIVSTAHALGLEVVAEGVETLEQLEVLRGLRHRNDVDLVCDRAQGFHLGRPLPSDAALELLLRRGP